MSKKKIAVLVGSLRKESANRKLANEVIRLAPDSLDLEIVEIGQLAHYNEDLDLNPPLEWIEFRKKIGEADGFLFFTPEYNRSISGVMKNALDVASRPYGQNKWGGKPGAIVSSSMSALGGESANHALRQPMVFLNVYMMQQPEAYIGNSLQLFDENNSLKNDDTRKFLQSWVNAFAEWVYRF
ncbi:MULTISPECIES: NADPH-dependent FMN reductase [Proteiniphilum]|jgi:chromate reductase|uniref:NADPH-dependent FMN reductase n=1 Tax=Proteiniphilum TaxID=294702 RepID=UPI001EEA795B|nr:MULTISPECIES: NAD(P)H-dependent oxidoreductase [Proteiniphilum]ULB34463.1 NAD(P)H-dependent oxidoreductase [Proteiniphilum propionicum]